MRIQYLGTAAAEGWPALFCRCENCRRARALGGKNIRSRSQSLIDQRLLVDFPPDSYHHFISHDLPFDSVDHVLVTHSHSDHFFPDDIYCRREPFSNGIPNPITVYGNEKVKSRMQWAMDAEWGEEADDRVRFVQVNAFEKLEIADYTVTPLLANHDKREICYIYLISDGDKTILYGNDTGIFPEETWEAIKGKHIDLVSLDCTFMLHQEGSNHMGLPDNAAVKERLISMGCTNEKTIFIVNHFSHNGGCMHDEMEEACSAAGFLVTYDGMVVDI